MKKTFFFICLIIFLLCFPSAFIFNVSSDPPEDEPEPFIYYDMPSSSFGSGNLKVVNWSFFRDMFQSHFYKDCNYKRYSYSSWTGGNQYVGIEKSWNDSGFWKINITLDVPIDIFEVNISFGCDIPVLNYVERDGYEIWLNYSIDNSSEVYSVFFNWSDIASISGLTITKHYDDVSKIWWISLHRNNVPAGFYSFDPIFGENTVGSGNTYLNSIDRNAGGLFTLSEGATGDYIMLYIKTSSNPVDVNCRIYYENHSHVLNGETVEVSVTNTNPDWIRFNYSGTKPNMVAGNYFLMVKSDYTASSRMYYYFDDTGGLGRIYNDDDGINYPNWDNPLDNDSWYIADLVSIYCSYTEGAPSNNNPVQSGEAPVNSSTGTSNSPDVFVICTDSDGADVMNATFSSNSSGTWKDFASNSSISSGTNITQNFVNASVDNTKYWWNVSLSDGEGGWDNETYHFTVAPNSVPTLSGEDPYNGSTDVATTPALYVICSDGDATDVLNVTWRYNDSFDWWTFGENVSVSSGTNITQTNSNFSNNSQTYYWSINCTDGEGGWVNETYHFTTVSAVNNPPVLSGESPVNSSTDINRMPDVFVVCTDSDSDIMNATWSSNSSGTWKNFATNSSISSGTNITQNFVNASSYGTTYWWNVSLSDGEGNYDNETYHFTIESNVAVVLSNLNPANNSYNNGINLTWNITCEDANGDTFNWTIECNNGNTSNANDDTNGSKTLSIGWLDWFTSYTVWVNATDGNLTTNESFVFTTMNETVGSITVTSEFPSNGSSAAPVQPYLYVTVNHSLGETMNISWYYGASEGSENTLLGTDVNITNGTENQLFLQASSYNTEYFWRVMVNDGEGLWINETFIFNTTGTGGSGRTTSLWIIGVLFGIFGIMSLFLTTRRKEMKKIKKPKNHSGDEYYGSGY